MGASASSKRELMAQLDELDQQELQMNLKLKQMQTQLNGMVPKEERVKVNKDLTPKSKIIKSYDAIAVGKNSSTKNAGNKKDNKKGKLKKKE